MKVQEVLRKLKKIFVKRRYKDILFRFVFREKAELLQFPRFIVFYNGEDEMPEELYIRLSEAFEQKEDEPAVECVAKFININYGCNKELMEQCKRLGEYSLFIQCVRDYLEKGYGQKQAIVNAVDECINKGILKDVLVKHRAEVFDMFLTKFDKKMYEEAIKLDAREDGLAEGRNSLAREHAERLKNNGISYEVARKIVTELDEDTLKEIYKNQ